MSPQLIKKAKFADILNKPSTNKQEAKKFLAKYPIDYNISDILLPDSFELKANKKQTKIRLIDRCDKDNPRIAYAVDIEISAEKIAHKTCTQILVWASSSNEDLLIGFPRKVFNHLLKTYTIMITDQQPPPDGKRFWERRIAQAFKDDLWVYFLNKTDDTLQLTSIKNNDDFLENYQPNSWGNNKTHQQHLFIISATQLSE
jgi:hypothetical protein